MATKAYDPGKPGEITSHGKGRFTVASFREVSKVYNVNLNDRSCDCPHSARRGAFCKHLSLAEETSYQTALRIARSLDDAGLEEQAARTDLRPEVREAIATVRRMNADRFQNAA